MLVNTLSTSNETINSAEVHRLVISLTNEKVPRAKKSVGMQESRSVQRNLAKLQLYVPIEKTICRKGGANDGLRTLYNFGKPSEIRTG